MKEVNEHINNNSILFLKLGEKYLRSAKVMLKNMVENKNETVGIGNSEEEAIEDMNNKSEISDITLFIPALFCYLQGIELFEKGMILLKNNEFDPQENGGHIFENMLDKDIKKLYGQSSEVYKAFKKLIKFRFMIDKFKKTNNISNLKDMYQCLRYPINKNNKVDYTDLIMQGTKAIKYYKCLIDDIDCFISIIVKEYHAR